MATEHNTQHTGTNTIDEAIQARATEQICWRLKSDLANYLQLTGPGLEHSGCTARPPSEKGAAGSKGTQARAEGFGPMTAANDGTGCNMSSMISKRRSCSRVGCKNELIIVSITNKTK
eukprot:1160962-Pelagomonas_calceolata.AAC.2